MKVTKVSQKYKDMSDGDLEKLIREKLSMDPKWVRRALTALYDEQTEAEQNDPVNVHESNGRGFSEHDQEFLTSLAKQALAGNVSFSQKQLGWLYKLLPKYAGQMVKLVRELERMEEGFVFVIYFSQVILSTERAEMEAVTGDLGLDSRSMPNNIVVRSPSGDMMYPFVFHDTVFGSDGPTPFVNKFIYKGMIEKIYRGERSVREWTLIITEGDPNPIPTLEEALDMMSGQKGLKKKDV